MILTLILIAPMCAEAGQSSMDPRLEFGLGVSTRIRVKEPRPVVLLALREKLP